MSTVTTHYAISESGHTDGVDAPTKGGDLDVGQGGAGVVDRTFIGFDTSSVHASQRITSALLRTKVRTKTGSPGAAGAFGLHGGVVFGAVLDTADYTVSALHFGTAIDAADVAEAENTMQVPSAFVKRDGQTDISLRLDDEGLGANQEWALHGANAATASKPLLTITTETESEYTEDPAIGAEAWLAFAREATEGTAVKAKVVLDMVTASLQATPENIESRAITSQRARPAKLAVGASAAAGDVEYEVTPEKCTQILPALLKLDSTSGPDGDGIYAHTFKLATSTELATMTFVRRIGQYAFVYPGCWVSSWELGVGLDELLVARLAVLGLTEYEYDDTARGADNENVLSASSGADTLVPMSFIGGQLELPSGTAIEDIQNLRIRVINNVRPLRGIRRARQPRRHFPLGCRVELEFETIFTTDEELRRFKSDSGLDSPSTVGTVLQDDSFVADFQGELGEAKQQLQVSIGRLNYTAFPLAVGGEEEITARVTGIGRYKTADASNVVIVVKNTEPASAFAASTEPITLLPEGV